MGDYNNTNGTFHWTPSSKALPHTVDQKGDQENFYLDTRYVSVDHVREITKGIRRKEAAGPKGESQIDGHFCALGGDNAEMMGPEHAAAAAPSYFNNRKLSIFGGSNEVQRSIITKAIMGL